MGFLQFGSTSDPYAGGDTYGYGGGPVIPFNIATTGKNSPATATAYVTPQVQLDASVGVGGTSRAINTSNITGDLSIFTNDPDVLKSGNDFALQVIAGTVGTQAKLTDDVLNRAFDYATGSGASAFKLVSENTIDSLKFAAGVQKGWADEFANLQASSTNFTQQVLDDVTSLYGQSNAALISQVNRAVSQLGDSQMAALNFFGTETQQLQNATTKAIDTVALRTSSEQAQGFDSLQQTFVKIAIGLGVTIVIVAFISRGGLSKL